MNLSRKSLLVGFLIAVILFVLMSLLVDWGKIYRQIQTANWGYLCLASLALVGGYGIYAIRWRYLLDDEPGYLSVFHAANVGNLLNTLIPIRPGEPARIAILSAHEDISLVRVTSSFIVDRWLEQLMRMTAFIGAVAFGAGLAVSSATILGLLAFVIGLFILISWALNHQAWILECFPPWLARLPRVEEHGTRQALENLLGGLSTLSSPTRLAWAIAWSLLTWGLFWIFHYLVLLALGISVQNGYHMALSLGSLAFVPPSATTMPGMYHASMILPLSMLNYDREPLVTYAVLLNAVLMVWVVMLGLWGLATTGLSLRRFFSLR